MHDMGNHSQNKFCIETSEEQSWTDLFHNILSYFYYVSILKWNTKYHGMRYTNVGIFKSDLYKFHYFEKFIKI